MHPVYLLAAAVAVAVVVLGVLWNGGGGPQTVLFIDTHVHRVGTVLNGTYPSMFIDFPTYSYDPATGELNHITWNGEIAVNDSLLAVFGGGTSIGGDIGSGASTALVPVYALPFSYGGVELYSIGSDGTASLRFSGHNISLAPGQSWYNQSTAVECEPGRYCVEVTANRTAVNYGPIPVANLHYEG